MVPIHPQPSCMSSARSGVVQAISFPPDAFTSTAHAYVQNHLDSFSLLTEEMREVKDKKLGRTSEQTEVQEAGI